MIEIWYVVWALFSLGGQPVTSPQFMSGPYPSQSECVEAGTAMDYPADSEVAKLAPVGAPVQVVMGCVQIHLDPPVVDGPKVTT